MGTQNNENLAAFFSDSLNMPFFSLQIAEINQKNMNIYDQNFQYNKRCPCKPSDFIELRENPLSIVNGTLLRNSEFLDLTKGVPVSQVISLN